MEQVDLAKLTQPFPRNAIKQRAAGGGRMLDYVEGHAVIHRLNDATGNRWDMEVKDITSKEIGPNTLMMARVALTLPGLGTREGLGVQMVHERGGEDLVKGCVTDALKKAATLFGVGLELYGPDYEAGETAQPARPAPLAERVRIQQPQPTPERATAPTSPPQGPPATPTQLKRMHAIARDLGWADAKWKPAVYTDYSVAHVNELTEPQADAVIAILAKKLQQRPLIDADKSFTTPAAPPGESGNDQWVR